MGVARTTLSFDEEATVPDVSWLFLFDVVSTSVGGTLDERLGDARDCVDESAFIEGAFECLRPQNEKKPPCFVEVVESGVSACVFSRILHPAGTTSSSTTNFLSFTAVSHAVDPLVAR